jgi:cysteine-rich repeat protein
MAPRTSRVAYVVAVALALGCSEDPVTGVTPDVPTIDAPSDIVLTEDGDNDDTPTTDDNPQPPDKPVSDDTPVGDDVPVGEDVPASDVPVGEDVPVVDVPVIDVPAVDVRTVPDVPVVDVRTVPDVPVLDVPVVPDRPVVDVPVVDVRVVDVPVARCGNRVVEAGEQCDDGNTMAGDGCENNCRFSCETNAQCADMEACNGAETCNVTTHRCAPGTAPADGTACGAGRICRRAVCVAAQCGDTIVTAPEQCDDGNTVAGDGCENTCRFSCETNAQCADTEPCNGAETCNVATHRCVRGTPLADSTACGTGRICRAGACTTTRCGNRIVEPGEQCDDGNTVAGDGCENTCRFSCENNTQCADTEPCNGAETCNVTTHRCAPGTALADNTTCGTGRVCRMAVCTATRCGNRIVEPGEQCDDGNTVAGDGCESSCRFSCESNTQCADTEACNGAETCNTTTHRCAAGTALPDGRACGTGRICARAVCVMSRCGDGIVDPMRGETCEPPTLNCDPTTCTIVVPPRCGDGRVNAPTEQCDDGNTARWDGCSDICRLEQTVRVDNGGLVGGGSALTNACDLTGDRVNDNRLGQALTDLALGQVNMGLQTSFSSGGTIILAHVLDLDDRTGVNDPSIRIAFFEGLDAMAPFSGAAGEEFAIRATALDAMRNPTSVLSPGSITTRALAAGPGRATLVLDLGTGTPSPLTLERATTSATTTTDAALQRIATLTGGRLCGALRAADLDRIPAPTGLPATCLSPMGGTSLLDVIAVGCSISIIPVINATQPDIDLGADGIFQGGVNRALRDTNGDRIVDTCRDGTTGVTITGTNCAQDPRFDDAYSMALTYTARRVVITAVR